MTTVCAERIEEGIFMFSTIKCRDMLSGIYFTEMNQVVTLPLRMRIIDLSEGQTLAFVALQRSR